MKKAPRIPKEPALRYDTVCRAMLVEHRYYPIHAVLQVMSLIYDEVKRETYDL
jgi:hypothetical protein